MARRRARRSKNPEPRPYTRDELGYLYADAPPAIKPYLVDPDFRPGEMYQSEELDKILTQIDDYRARQRESGRGDVYDSRLDTDWTAVWSDLEPGKPKAFVRSDTQGNWWKDYYYYADEPEDLGRDDYLATVRSEAHQDEIDQKNEATRRLVAELDEQVRHGKLNHAGLRFLGNTAPLPSDVNYLASQSQDTILNLLSDHDGMLSLRGEPPLVIPKSLRKTVAEATFFDAIKPLSEPQKALFGLAIASYGTPVTPDILCRMWRQGPDLDDLKGVGAVQILGNAPAGIGFSAFCLALAGKPIASKTVVKFVDRYMPPSHKGIITPDRIEQLSMTLPFPVPFDVAFKHLVTKIKNPKQARLSDISDKGRIAESQC